MHSGPAEYGNAAGFYRRTVKVLIDAEVPFLIGGGYAMRILADVHRQSPDLDLFVRARDRSALLDACERAGLRAEVAFGHWLAKVREGSQYVDVIYNSGNAVTPVDDGWFEHAIPATFQGIPVQVCPPEETIWSKAFVIERERCDVADVMHVLRRRAKELDWGRLIARFGDQWRILLSHLVTFGFVYPGHAGDVPRPVLDELLRRLREEPIDPTSRVCRGTLISREQYLTDVHDWGYEDARLAPEGNMRPSEIDRWTAAIPKR